MFGDWHRDPWGWPEYQYEASTGFHETRARCLASTVRRAAKLDVPKGNFATRPALVLDPIDRLAYQALVDRLSNRLIGDLDPAVCGWRLVHDSPTSGHYARNDHEWERYRSRLQRLVAANAFGLQTDVVSCFASVPVDRLMEDVRRRGGSADVSERIETLVAGWSSIPGRSGVAQRSAASSTLVNLYLGRLDRALQSYSASARSWLDLQAHDAKRFVRWMDDIWVFGSDESKLRALQFELQEIARDAGLELNAAKTHLLEGDALAAAALRVEHSAVDDALIEETPDSEPLEALVDGLLAAPEQADRTSIRFATSRMRAHKLDSRVDALLDAAERMPQGADHLARLARDFGRWQDRQDWYLEYCLSPWACVEWAVAQLGTMFPSKITPSASIVDLFEERLSSPRSLLMTALATQRLVAWDVARAREVLRANLAQMSAPAERRLVALAGLAAKEEKRWIRGVLAEYEENSLLLKIIEERGWKPFPAEPDFAASSSE